MNLKKIINDYVECNEFEIKVKDGKVKIYYYDKVENFSNTKITISKKNQLVSIVGNKLIIETMFKEMIVISGDIEKVILGHIDE